MKKLDGDLFLKKDEKLEVEYEEVTGDINLWEGAQLTLPNLQSCGGSINLAERAQFTAPNLQDCGDYITLEESTQFTAPNLEACGGYINLWEGAQLTLPNLQSCGRSINLAERAQFTAPNLKACGGSINLAERAQLTAPLIKKNDPTAKAECDKILGRAFENAGYSFADKILSKIGSRRGNVMRVRVCGKTDISYLVTDGESWSHGQTLREARENLIYKIGNRDTSTYKSWTLDTEVSKAEGIKAYRVITGACEYGVRWWLQNKKTPETITVAGIIELTKGAYGNEKFKEFFKQEREIK